MPEPVVDQPAVRAALAAVGGYWRPSAGVLRLLEELGEVSAALDHGDAQELGDELADVWIISTAIADQYLAAVAPLAVDAGAGPASAGDAAAGQQSAVDQAFAAAPAAADGPHRLLAELVVHAGRIARIVNHYDGPKTPKTLDGWIALGPATAALHGTLLALAAAHGVRLGAVVAGKLALLTERDRGRFAPSSDASTAPVLVRVRAAHPELAGARLLGAPNWNPASADLAADAALATITTFVKAADPEHLDGLLVPAPPGLHGAALAGWWGELAARARQAGRPIEPAWARATVVEPASGTASGTGAASGFAVVQRRASIATSALSRLPWWERARA